MPAKKGESLDDVLGRFSQRLEQTVRAPNINRWTPLPKQDLFLQRQTKGGILFGGNRAGKTEVGVADDCMILTRRHKWRNHFYPPTGPLQMRFIGVDFDRGIKQGAIPKFQQLLPPSALINGNWSDSYRESEHMLTLADGSTVSFMSYEQQPNKFQIVSLHHIHFDEEPPKAIFDESMLRLTDVAGTWTLTETPVQQLEWVQDELMEPAEAGMRPDISVFYLSTLENVNLPPDELQLLLSTISVEEQVVRLSGRYKSGSMVFNEFERRWPYVIPQESFKLTEEWVVYESMDHGIVNPAAWLWTAAHPDGSIITFKMQYAKGIVVESWAKIVHETRKEIAREHGISDLQFMSQLRGTVGDPSISDHGNASAQTGLTIQQAYALAGIYIATDGIRQARSGGNQNIGLDKMHTYLSPRPSHHPRGPVPWWQMTDNCTPLIDEVKKARKPKQSAANKEIQNASEKIRDKDNHAIDAAKYLFLMTHDLRPESYRTADDQTNRELGRQLNAVPTQPDTHADVYNATMTSASQRGYSPDSYFAMEE